MQAWLVAVRSELLHKPQPIFYKQIIFNSNYTKEMKNSNRKIVVHLFLAKTRVLTHCLAFFEYIHKLSQSMIL